MASQASQELLKHLIVPGHNSQPSSSSLLHSRPRSSVLRSGGGSLHLSLPSSYKTMSSSQYALSDDVVDVSQPQHMQHDTAAHSPQSGATQVMNGMSLRQNSQLNAENLPPQSAQPLLRPAADGTFAVEDFLASLPPYKPPEPRQPMPSQRELREQALARQQIVALPSKKPTGEYVGRLNMACQKRSLPLLFETSEVDGGFSVKVTFGDHELDDAGPYSTKKLAKEAISERALAIAEALPLRAKRKGVNGQLMSHEQIKAEPMEEENWVSILNTHAQRKGHMMPEFQEFSTAPNGQRAGIPAQFACTVAIQDGLMMPFGSATFLFPTKKEARANASKEAVLWLKQSGQLSEKTNKRRKSSGTETEFQSPGCHAGSDAAAKIEEEKKSYPQRVQELATEVLGLNAPQYKFLPTTLPSGEVSLDSSVVSGGAYFHDRDVRTNPVLAGCVGEVRNVRGKKEAKDQCCRQVLGVLEQIKCARSWKLGSEMPSLT